MATRVDPDLWGSASHLAMRDALTGPFAAGAGDIPLEIEAGGQVQVPVLRLPALLVGLRRSLADAGIGVAAAVTGGPTVELAFGPWTEAGAWLPVHAPAADPATGLAAPFEVTLTVRAVAADGTATDMTLDDARDAVEVRVISGVLGRLAYCLGAEQARIRRTAREIGMARRLATARDDALDRHGADLSVPRLADRLAFAPPPGDGAPVPPDDHRIVGIAEREADVAYRRRLGLYRSFGRTTPIDLGLRLNGPGADADPNAGPLAGLGVQARFTVIEADNPFAVAVRIAGPPDDKAAFLDYLRRVHLEWPSASATARAIHDARYLPASIRDAVDARRSRVREAFDLQVDAPMAPLLASSLDRLGRVRKALTGDVGWALLRAQDDAGGSRHELGLGVEVSPLTAAELNALRGKLVPGRDADPDPDLEALIASLVPAAPADDPDGRWLLEPCGLRTIHRVAANRLYLSHLPAFGLVIDEGPGATPEQVPLEARYHAPGDPGRNAAIVGGLADAAARWTGDAWTGVTDSDAATLWGTAERDATAEGVFRGAGLPVVVDGAATAARLARLPTEVLETIRLAPSQAARIRTVASAPAATNELRTLLAVLRDAGLASVLPLALPGGDVLLVVGAIGLPEAGLNLSDRRSTGFRWYAVPIRGKGARVRAVGSRTVLRKPAEGLVAVVALGYLRGALSDPFEYRLELPEGVTLTLEQYEFLMNLIDRANPIGVEINTFAIRRRHVDLDGDGEAEPLTPSAARTFRRFHRPRHRGETAVPLNPNP